MAVFATASRLQLLYALGDDERSVDELAEADARRAQDDFAGSTNPCG